MHRFMSLRRLTIATLPIVLLATVGGVPIIGTALGNDNVRVLGPGNPDDSPALRVLNNDPSRVELDVTLPTVVVEDVEVLGQTYQILGIPGGGDSGEVGDPLLPTFSRFVAIPDRADVQVSAVVEEEEELQGFHLLPMQSEDGLEFSYNPQTYARDSYGDEPVARVGAPAVMRGLRLVPLTLAPVRYNPAEGTLRIARRLKVEVTFSGENLTNTPSRPLQSIAPSFDRLYRELVVNYEEIGERYPVENGTYVIICPNDNNVITRLQPLLDWRKREGYPVYLATTAETGTSSSSIKTWLTNAYNGWPTPPEFVALAGDCDGSYAIPTFSYSGGEGDHPYTQLDGGDLICDVHLGRLSFNTTTELEVIVAKTVGYESTPYTNSDPEWFTRACLVGDQSHSGYSCIQVQQWIKTRLLQLGYTQIDTIFGGSFVSQMQTALNRGDTVFCYRGYYGFSGWSNSYTYGLTNFFKLPFAVHSTCGTGDFQGATSNSEAFLRAGTVSQPKAAIGAIGTSTLSTHTRYNNCMTMGTWYGVLYEDMWEMGAAMSRGKLALYLNYYQSDASGATAFCYWNNLMGDPACPVWTGYPEPLDVTYPSTVAVGANSVIITVDEDGGGPCQGARVCLLKEDGATFVTGWTDAAGTVELPVSLTTAGTMKLTVTKHNRAPLLANITVAAQSVYVGYQASTIDDDSSGGSQGNGDGQVNPGETIQLSVQVKNFGSQTASNVTGVLSSSDPYITIIDGSDSFGSIAGGATAWSASPFVFSVAGGCPHGHMARFGLNVTSGANTWHSLIDLKVDSAELNASTVTVYDGGNGHLDPGENVEISIRLRNDGVLNAQNVTAVLTSNSAWVTVVDAVGSYGTINAGGSADNGTDRFRVSVDPGTFEGHEAELRLITTFNGTLKDTTFAYAIVGTVTSNDPVGPDLYGYYAFDDTDTGYPDAPTYNWIELNPNLGGDGTQVTLGDYDTYQDKSRTVDLPFTFQFYGEPFNVATICSNGWVAMGSTYLTNYRNWTIPSPGAPQNLIAVFWDDLHETTTGGGGHVYQKYDAANHTWIVEWSRLVNEVNSSSQETFEVIFFDPAVYPTVSGDGMILMQYQTVNQVDGTDGYCTVGIQNQDMSDGLLYTYYNRYPTAAATLGTGRAILFLPATAVPQGTIEGTVRNASHNNDPLEGAEVWVVEAGRTFFSGPDGIYSGSAPEGTYTVICSRQGFEPDTTYGVQIIPPQTSTLNYFLTDNAGPDLSNVTQLTSTYDTNGPYVVQANAADASGVSSVALFYRVNLSSWVQVPMANISAGLYQGEIPGMAAGLTIDYYVRGTDSIAHVSYDPPGAPDEFYTFRITTLAYDTECEDPGDPDWQLGVAGDDATTGIWIRDDPVGTEYNGQPIQPEDDHTPDPGVKCFVTGNGDVGGAPGDNDVDGGCTTLMSPTFDLSQADEAYVRYWRWWGEGGNSTDDEFIADVSSDGGNTWVDLERIPDPMGAWGEFFADLASVITLSDQVVFRFVACDLGTAGLVEAAVDDFSIETFVPDVSAAPSDGERGPAVFMLNRARPNPFTGSTSIGFSLARQGHARLLVYDVQGRCVRHLLDGNAAAGPHTYVWDGRDDGGRQVSSGLYFYRLESEGQGRVQRLMRVE